MRAGTSVFIALLREAEPSDQRGKGVTALDVLSIVLSTLAFFFAIASFWWMHVRRGRLRLAGQPRSFALSTASGLVLNVPLAFMNTGPTAIAAVNLRLRFDEGGWPPQMPFVATRPGVGPKTDDDRPYATTIVLSGRDSRVICCEFIARPWNTILRGGRVNATVEVYEVRSWGKARWRILGEISLLISDRVLDAHTQYIAHDNYPGGEQ